MHDKFGVTAVVKSFKKLAQDAKDIPDQDAGKVLGGWDVYTEGVSERSMLSTAKMYIALSKLQGLQVEERTTKK
jgi:hypothetical protein